RLPLAELAIKSKYVYYSEKTNSYCPNEDFCPSDAPEAMNFAWEAWQAAKAQAVPEGFILVPKEPTQAMLDSARDWSTKKYGKAVGNDGASGCYKAMIEAQEPAND